MGMADHMAVTHANMSPYFPSMLMLPHTIPLNVFLKHYLIVC